MTRCGAQPSWRKKRRGNGHDPAGNGAADSSPLTSRTIWTASMPVFPIPEVVRYEPYRPMSREEAGQTLASRLDQRGILGDGTKDRRQVISAISIWAAGSFSRWSWGMYWPASIGAGLCQGRLSGFDRRSLPAGRASHLRGVRSPERSVMAAAGTAGHGAGSASSSKRVFLDGRSRAFPCGRTPVCTRC